MQFWAMTSDTNWCHRVLAGTGAIVCALTLTACAQAATIATPSSSATSTTIASTGPSPSPITTTTTTPAGPTVPAAAIADCAEIGGSPRQGGWDKLYIAGPTYLDPACLDVPYIGTDGMTYYVDLPLGSSGPEPVNMRGTTASEEECRTGSYPMANPGVNTPGSWDAALGLCLLGGN
jgi:hypothetical protein